MSRHAPPSGFRVFMYVLMFSLLGMAIEVAMKVQP